VLRSQAERDAGDRSRPVGRLEPAADAILLETDCLSCAEVVDRLVALIEARRRAATAG
jgi:cytidylate kinase